MLSGGVLFFADQSLAETAPSAIAAVDRLKDDALAALKRGEFDRSSQLFQQAATTSGDPALNLMASWVSNFNTQYEKTLADRKDLYDKAVAQVKLLQEKGKPDYAIDSATRAYLLAIDKLAFRHEAWVDALVKERTAAAADYEKSGQWQRAARTYLDLEAIEPANPLWKTKLKVAARYVRIQAFYTPDYFKQLLQAKQKEDDQVDALLEAAGVFTPSTTKLAKSSPTTHPTTHPSDGAGEMDAKIDWHDSLRVIEFEMIGVALRDAVKNYYRPTNYHELFKGGLNGLRILATTPEIGKAFPSLDDPKRREAFVQAVDDALSDVASASESEYATYRAVLVKLRDANQRTVVLPENVLTNEFMDGALGELDPFSSMIWPQQLEEFRTSTEGEFSGVGIQIERDESGALKVVSPIEDTPAYRAGIKAGDFITHINGEFVKGILLDQAVKKIKGPTGTKVTLTVRAPNGVVKDYTLKRDTIKVTSIKGWKRQPGGGWDWMIDPVQHIGYVRLSSFSKTTAEDLEHALQQMREAGACGMVLDLRADPGGLLNAAVKVADKFIVKGTIVSTHADRDTPQQPSLDEADPDSKKYDLPLVVLVNQMSASASEILSGALKDHHRAIIVGDRSFGKGSVQMLLPVSSRNAVLKLTTSHYYLPSGRCLHREETSTEWGVEPDYHIEMTPEQVRAAIDARQQMDVVWAPMDQPRPATTQAKPVDLLEVDPQLSAAVLLMRLQIAGVKLQS